MANVNFDFGKCGFEPYKQFNKVDKGEKEDGYVSAQELYLFSSKPLGGGKKANIKHIMQEQKVFQQYDNDKNGKLDITEYTKMLSDSNYLNNILPMLGRGGLSDVGIRVTKAHAICMPCTPAQSLVVPD